MLLEIHGRQTFLLVRWFRCESPGEHLVHLEAIVHHVYRWVIFFSHILVCHGSRTVPHVYTAPCPSTASSRKKMKKPITTLINFNFDLFKTFSLEKSITFVLCKHTAASFFRWPDTREMFNLDKSQIMPAG